MPRPATNWVGFIEFCNKRVGQTIQLRPTANRLRVPVNTMQSYRTYLVGTGHLRVTGPGVWLIMKAIPADVTIKEVKEAPGGSLAR